MDISSEGYVITTNVASIGRIACDEVWQITRANKHIRGAIWVPELAPSSRLFNKYIKEWKGKPPDEWWPLYRAMFNQELGTTQKFNVLRRLWRTVRSGRIIALACFCKDGTYCHRRLVGEFLTAQGLRVEERIMGDTSKQHTGQLTMFK